MLGGRRNRNWSTILEGEDAADIEEQVVASPSQVSLISTPGDDKRNRLLSSSSTSGPARRHLRTSSGPSIFGSSPGHRFEAGDTDSDGDAAAGSSSDHAAAVPAGEAPAMDHWVLPLWETPVAPSPEPSMSCASSEELVEGGDKS
mmetsp:Transcript_165324/g.525372  ORF Transcript_165324/g.525372 Transcript_165324/m.525372 type:complete len:145 (+) Transcript_165324:144-578(+)